MGNSSSFEVNQDQSNILEASIRATARTATPNLRPAVQFYERPSSYVFQHKPDSLSELWDKIWDWYENTGANLDDLVRQFDPQSTGWIPKDNLGKLFLHFGEQVGPGHFTNLCYENGDGGQVYIQSLVLRICGLRDQIEGSFDSTNPPAQRPCNYTYRGQPDQLSNIWSLIWGYCENQKRDLDQLVLQYDQRKNGLISKEQLVQMLYSFGVQLSEPQINQIWFDHQKNGQVNLHELVFRIKGFLNGNRGLAAQMRSSTPTPMRSSTPAPETNIQPAANSLSGRRYEFRGLPDPLAELWEMMRLYCENRGLNMEETVLQFDRSKTGLISKVELTSMLTFFQVTVAVSKINDLCVEHNLNGQVDLKSLFSRIKGLSNEEDLQPLISGMQKAFTSPSLETEESKISDPAGKVELMIQDSIELNTGKNMKLLRYNKIWENGKQVVMKILYFQVQPELDKIQKEARINYRLNHIPRISEVYEDHCLPNEAGGFKLVLISEYAPQSSLDFLIKKRAQTHNKFRENQLASFLSKAVAIFAATEKLGIAHRDIKPGNILICADGDFKVCDFGVSRQCSQDTLLDTLVGTPVYLSYELKNAFVDQLESNRVPSTFNWFKNDVMSLAIVVIHMALLDMTRILNTAKSAVEDQRRAFEDMAYLSTSFKNILKEMLAVNPAHRPNFTTLLSKLQSVRNEHAKLTDPIEESKNPGAGRRATVQLALKNATIDSQNSTADTSGPRSPETKLVELKQPVKGVRPAAAPTQPEKGSRPAASRGSRK